MAAARRAAPWVGMAAVILLFVFKGPLMAVWGGFENVAPREASRLVQEDGALLLDVRQPGEWEQAHIQGAKLVPLGDLEKRLPELEEARSRPIVVYCAVGGRSAVAAGRLRDAGFTKVYNMDGGIKAWMGDGLETQRGP